MFVVGVDSCLWRLAFRVSLCGGICNLGLCVIALSGNWDNILRHLASELRTFLKHSETFLSKYSVLVLRGLSSQYLHRVSFRGAGGH